MAFPESPIKPKRTLSLPLTICAVSVTLLLFSFPVTLPHFRTLLLPPCGHIVLISAARHGSSWFLNSAEGCPSSDTFDQLNLKSELWNSAQNGPVLDIGPIDAAEYVATTHSVKAFPLTLQNETLLRQFFDEVHHRGIPVFVLTRDLSDSYTSLATAQQEMEWNVNSAEATRREQGRGDGHVLEDDKGKAYKDRIKGFFQHARQMLGDLGIEFDEFDYNDVVEQRFIIGERNRCSIRNCNFG